MTTKNASKIASINVQFVLALNRKSQRILLIKNLTDLSILMFRIRKTEFVTLDPSSLLRFFQRCRYIIYQNLASSKVLRFLMHQSVLVLETALLVD